MKTSNCCGAPVADDSDICSKCGEHCLLVTDWLEAIRTERERQISKGKTAEFDDRVNEDGELVDKSCYMLDVSSGSKTILVQAAALIVAELERIERAEVVS